jgi:hypothetical protein
MMMSFRAAVVRPVIHCSRKYYIKHCDVKFECQIESTTVDILQRNHGYDVLKAISFIPRHRDIAIVNREIDFSRWKGTFCARLLTRLLDSMKLDHRFNQVEVS